MFLHPLVALFMVFWLGMAIKFALADSSAFPFAWVFVAFGVLLTLGAFFPEATRAKRLICEVLLSRSF